MRDKKIAGGPMTFIRKKEFAFKVRGNQALTHSTHACVRMCD